MSALEVHPVDAVSTAVRWAIAHGVAVEPWPAVAARPTDPDPYARRPLLLLVDEHADPPIVDDVLTTWMRLPGDSEELITRAWTVATRARTFGVAVTYVDADDVLRVGDRLAVLSPVEARIMRLLLDNVDTVVSRERLNRELWPDKPDGDLEILNGRVRMLRDHIAGLPLRIHTVRRRGLMLTVERSGLAGATRDP